ncbi:thiosulfate sulfurtransferase 18 [Daucus carota subsp. sativus]|uniref:Rhodanese domain-containing protein n=1 Tax=Daucus carota subsp. sativus TaxID=79200 RepID=A0A161ZYE2_DAUCS|nr:PREDICTED: thiosulfate sulfurtransferase 18-like [Daucus carota subsp. sativus]
MANFFYFLLRLIVILLLSSTSYSDVEVVTIDVHATKDLMNSGNHRYLDVRTEEEFKNGHVDVKNIVNIPYMFETPQGRVKNPKFMEQVLSTFKKDDNLIVGCQKGIRSVYATIDLLKSEFKQVYNMGSGYLAWIDNNLAVKIPEPEARSEEL